MTENLIDIIKGYITPDVINKAGTFLQESPANTSKAMAGIVPTLLGSITNMASSPEGATQLNGLLSSGGHDGSILNNLSGLFAGGSATNAAIQQGQGLLSTLFGTKSDSVTSAISASSGVSTSSAASLLALAAPLVMGVIGKLRSTRGLNASGLANLLAGYKGSIASAMPAGVAQVADDYDVHGLRSVTVAPIAAAKAGGMRTWLPVLALLVIGLGFLAYLMGRGKSNVPTAAAMEQIKLCSGEERALRTGSFNYNLARYLADGGDAQPPPRTFVFDNLNFESATTDLTPSSRQTVEDLIAILKACPNAQVQLVGHTDSTGDAAANQTLSLNRAAAIQQMLAAGGVGADRITTAGYGEDKPIASNESDEGRARNRRTELVVVKR